MTSSTQLGLELNPIAMVSRDESCGSQEAQRPSLSPLEREFINAHLIFHGHGGWDADVPDWIRAQLPHARREYLRNNGNPNLACELDVVIYLMTASLEQPLGSEWTHIYLHTAFKAIQRYGANFVRLPNDEDDLAREAERPLSQYETTLLNDLRGKIRAAQIKHAKCAARISRRKEKNLPDSAKTPTNL